MLYVCKPHVCAATLRSVRDDHGILDSFEGNHAPEGHAHLALVFVYLPCPACGFCSIHQHTSGARVRFSCFHTGEHVVTYTSCAKVTAPSKPARHSFRS